MPRWADLAIRIEGRAGRSEVVEMQHNRLMRRMDEQMGKDAQAHQTSGMFNNMSRNKRGVTANVWHPGGREMVERLIKQADAVLENFSAGVMTRFWSPLAEPAGRIPGVTRII